MSIPRTTVSPFEVASPPPPPAPAPQPAPTSGLAELAEPLPAPATVTEPIRLPEPEPVFLEPEPRPAPQRTARLNPDGRPVLFVTVGFVTLLMLSSFAMSFASIYAVTEYTGVDEGLWWLPPVFVDLAILTYTLSLFVFKARGEKVGRTITGLIVFSALSIALNVAHTYAYWNADLSNYQAWVGIAITAAAPIAVLLASEEIGRLAFEKIDTPTP